MLLDTIKFDPSRPIIARAAGSALIGSLNFSIASLIVRDLKAQRRGTPVLEASGVDGANTEAADLEEAKEELRVRAEQGFAIEMPLLQQAAMLKAVRDSVADDLLSNAEMRPLITDPSKSIPDPFHVGQSFEDSLKFQIGMDERKPSEAMIRAQAKALNVEEKDIRDAYTKRHLRQVQFLRDNKAEIITIYNGLSAKAEDGHAYSHEDADVIFGRLPAMAQLRVAKAADQGLYKSRARELERHLSSGLTESEAGGNVALLDGTRRELLEEVASWMKQEKFAREVSEARSRGANMPQFMPAPRPVQPDEVDVAKEQHAQRTGTTG